MSLYESGESNGQVSLKKLFDGEEKLKNGCISNSSLEDIIFAACRGGRPYSLNVKSKDEQLRVAKDYFHQIYRKDIFSVDGIRRDPLLMQVILKSYARNISTVAKKINIIKDVKKPKRSVKKRLIIILMSCKDYILLMTYKVGHLILEAKQQLEPVAKENLLIHLLSQLL